MLNDTNLGEFRTNLMSGAPKYVRLANVFRSKIASGNWPIGFQIPTIDQLCKDYSVARVTIRQALSLLTQEGLVAGHRGRGTFVISAGQAAVGGDSVLDILNEFGSVGRIRLLARERNVEVPDLLRRGRRQVGNFIRIRKVNMRSNSVLFLMDFYTKVDLYDRFVDTLEEKFPIQNLLKPYFLEHKAMVDTFIHVIHLDNEIAEVMGSDVSMPAAELVRTFYDIDGDLIAASRSVYSPGIFQYKLTQSADEYFRSRFPSSTSSG